MSNLLKGGRSTYGQAIGILVLDTTFPRAPGDMGNASTWRFPVRYQRVVGATASRVVSQSDPSLLVPFIEAAQELERAGVRAITTTCGFLAMFQNELAAAVSIPVFTSGLLLVPLVHRMLKPDQKVGIVAGNSDTMGHRHYRGAGWSPEEIPIAVVGMQKWEHARQVIMEGAQELDTERLGREVVEAVQELVRENPDVGAIVFECTNIAPYAHLAQEAVGLPVFDIQTLTNMVYEGTHRQPYRGFM